MSQVDGAYPRLNAAMVSSGQYANQLVSLVGKFPNANWNEFQCSDGGRLQLDTTHAAAVEELPPPQRDMVVEIMGQVQGPSMVAVRSAFYAVLCVCV